MSGTIDHVNVSLKIDALLTKALDLDTPQDPLIISILASLSNGTASGQASQVWHDTRTLSASGTEDLDLAGSLTNAFGVTLTFAKVKVVFVRAATGNTNDVQVTRPSSNGVPLFMAAGDGIALAPGEWFVFFSPTVGKTVTAGTGDLLTITNSAGSTSVSYDIVVIGTD
jgi:hypothetical protein